MPNGPVPADAAGLPEYGFESAVSHIADLYQLLDTIQMAVGDMNFGAGPTRNHALDRVNSMLIIAREFTAVVFERSTGDRP